MISQSDFTVAVVQAVYDEDYIRIKKHFDIYAGTGTREISHIDTAIESLQSRWIPGRVPWEMEIAKRGVKDIPIVDGKYRVFFLEEYGVPTRRILYVHPNRMLLTVENIKARLAQLKKL